MGKPGLQTSASCTGRLLKILAASNFGPRFCKNMVLDPPPTHTFLKRPFLTDFKKYTHTLPTGRKFGALDQKIIKKRGGKVPKPTVLAHNECPREICIDNTHTHTHTQLTQDEQARQTTHSTAHQTNLVAPKAASRRRSERKI